MKRSSLCCVVTAVLVVSPAAVATAAIKNWNALSGNWNVGGNWNPAGVPAGGDTVNIALTDGVARTITYDVNAPSLGVISIDLTGAGVAASTLSIPNNFNLTAAVLDVGGYNGTVFTNGRGAVTQSAGTTTVSAGGDLILGVGSGSTGAYTLNGGALVTNQSQFYGLNGAGTFNHSGGTNTLNPVGVGGMFVGYNVGATGTYNLSGTGALTSNLDEYIGYNGIGAFNQTGGSHTIAFGKNLYLGFAFVGSTGTYTISGGTLTVGNDLVVGNTATGTLTIQGTGSVSVRTNVSINSTSNVNLNGGTLRFENLGSTVVGAGGYSRLNYTSGTIALAGVASRNLATDVVVTNLFGASPTVPAGKTLVLENGAEIYSNPAKTVRVNGGTLNAPSFLKIGKDVGGAQNGHLEVTNGGIVNSGQGEIGFDYFTNATATVSGPGSAWNVGGVLWVGGQGNSGTLNVRDGALVHVATTLYVWVDSFVNLDGGTIRFDNYTKFDNGVGDVGTFNFYAGTLQLAGNRNIGSDAAIADILGAAPTLPSNKGLTVEGTATLSTIVTLDGGTLSANQLANGYNLRLQRGTLNLANQAVTIGAGGLLGPTLDLNDDMTVNVTLGITNQGLVTGGGQLGGAFTNAAAGELRAEPGRSLKLTGANNANAGQINLFGGMLDFTQNLTNNAGAFISGNGTLKTATGLTNNGTMNFSGLANVVGDVTNSATGKIISSGGGPTTFLDDVVNQGEIRTTAGSFTVLFGAASGAGAYTGTGTVNFEGDLKPGNSAAAISFAGDVAFGLDATLEIEIGGTTAGSGYDRINVADQLSLGGTLEVALINGFNPAAGHTFDLLNWGTLSGTFASLNLPSLVGGLAWNTSQLYTTGVLTVTPGFLEADFDEDGDVDGIDLTRWRNNFGTGTTHMTGDADADGDADGADFLVWQRQLGFGASTQSSGTPPPVAGAAAAIPEPASLSIALSALVLMLRFRLRAT